MANDGGKERRWRGEGHVRKYGKYWWGHVSADGKRKYFSGATKQAVIEKIRMHSAEALTGVQLTPGSRSIRRTAPSVDDVKVESFLDRWISVHRTRIRTSTATRYDGLIENHLEPVVHNQAGAVERRRDPVLDHAGHVAVLVDGSARTPRYLRPLRTPRLCTNDPSSGWM